MAKSPLLANILTETTAGFDANQQQSCIPSFTACHATKEHFCVPILAGRRVSETKLLIRHKRNMEGHFNSALLLIILPVMVLCNCFGSIEWEL